MTDRTPHGRRWALLFGLLVTAACVGVVWIVVARQQPSNARPSLLAQLDVTDEQLTIDDEAEADIAAFCGDCHGLPRPESFPRDRWHYEVRKGYEFYIRSGRDDLKPPPTEQTLAYYRSHAAEKVKYPQPVDAANKLGTEFRAVPFPADPENPFPPEFSNFCWSRLSPAAPPQLLACEMRLGLVAAVDLSQDAPLPSPLARLHNPTHAETCDLDGDEVIDVIIADQGDYGAYDHRRGRVVWLRPNQRDRNTYELIVVADQLARAVDAQPADFDGDGDLDLVVAEFGWRTTGGITLLRNTAPAGRPPAFVAEPIDARPGAINVPVCDLNEDGRPDFVAVVSQEYEMVDAFINQGNAAFRRYTLWSGPDPMFGSSGISLTDLDGDGDQDILYTNGDAFDNNYVDPSHGVQWLENKGKMQFEYHRLADLSGAYRALAADVDLDGDQDIIAVAYLPPKSLPPNFNKLHHTSILCLEQLSSGVFARHTLETDRPYYATLQLADFDADGDPDFVVGPGPNIRHQSGGSPWLTVWWNQRKKRR